MRLHFETSLKPCDKRISPCCYLVTMSTFAKSNFNAIVYSASRPTYPLKLFEYIFSFHAGQGANSNNKPHWERAIDLGCGTGMILLCIITS